MRFGALTLLLCACKGKAPPQISIDVSPVSFEPVALADPPQVIEFNLILSNSGEDVLVIDGLTTRGDQNCHFTFEGPDLSELEEGQDAFVRGTFHPQAAARDQLALEITSNAGKFPTLVVPVCATIYIAGDTPPAMEICDVPPDDQPDCGTT